MNLLEEIQAKCPAQLIEARDCRAIADLVSVGRTRPEPATIGHGTVLEVLGLAEGNALLDAIYADANFRYARPLLEQGRLLVSSPIVVNALRDLVAANVLPAESAERLIALGLVPDPVSIEAVARALETL